MTREEAKATDPDATAALLTELQNAASYLNDPAASDKDGEPTAYGKIVGHRR